MKEKRYRIERKTIEEAIPSINSTAMRIKAFMAFSAEESLGTTRDFDLMCHYYITAIASVKEFTKILETGGKEFYLTKETIEKLNNYRNTLNLIEKQLENTKYSLRVH